MLNVSYDKLIELALKNKITSYQILYGLWSVASATIRQTEHEINDDELVTLVDNFWNYSTNDLFGHSAEELQELRHQSAAGSKMFRLVRKLTVNTDPLYMLKAGLVRMMNFIMDDLLDEGKKYLDATESFDWFVHFMDKVHPDKRSENRHYLNQIFWSSIETPTRNFQ